MMTKVFSIYSDTIFGYLQPVHFLNCLAHFREEAKLLKLKQGQKSILSAIPGGVLGISSDGDDRMEPKVKTQKNQLGFQQNPKKFLDQK